MSPLPELLNADNVVCHSDAGSRKRVLQYSAELLAERVGQSADTIFDGLMERERLGSTGLGEGVAIPHCRSDIAAMHVAALTLATPVEFEAPDGKPVDLVFVLLVPNNETQAHLDALAVLSELYSQDDNRSALRQCSNRDELLTTLKRMLEALA